MREVTVERCERRRDVFMHLINLMQDLKDKNGSNIILYYVNWRQLLLKLNTNRLLCTIGTIVITTHKVYYNKRSHL